MNPHLAINELAHGCFDDRASSFIRHGQRCYCFSSSKSATSTSTIDQRALAEGGGNAQSGTGNVQAGVLLTNSSVQLGLLGGDVASLINGVNAGNAQTLDKVTAALKADATEKTSGERNAIVLVALAGLGLAAYASSKK